MTQFMICSTNHRTKGSMEPKGNKEPNPLLLHKEQCGEGPRAGQQAKVPQGLDESFDITSLIQLLKNRLVHRRAVPLDSKIFTDPDGVIGCFHKSF